MKTGEIMGSDFYTNVVIRGDNILYRGIENGKHVRRKIPYQPTLFVNSIDETEWKTLDGRSLDKFTVGGILETNKFIKEHRGVSGFEIHGNLDHVYSFIAEDFPGEVDYDFSKLKVAYIDIETECESGFPDYKSPSERVIAITVFHDDIYYVFERVGHQNSRDFPSKSHQESRLQSKHVF